MKGNYFIVDLSTTIQNVGNYLNYNFVKKNLKVVDSQKSLYLLKFGDNKNKNKDFFNLLNLKYSFLINYIFSDDFKKINIKKNKIEFINYVKEKSLCVNKDNQKLINNVLDNIEKNNSLSEVDVIENLRNLI